MVKVSSHKRGVGLKRFEVYLEKTSGEQPDEYGFFPNPPMVLPAKSKKDALNQLKLPKNIKVVKILKEGEIDW